MKRASVLVLALVVALCMALPLAGCASGSYTPQLKDQAVDDSALDTSGTLRVGVNASNPPYSQQSSGSIIGIDVDIAAALADELGLKLELVDVGTATDTAFSKDSVDIVMGVSETNSSYWLSNPYLNSGVALFSLTENAQAPTAAGSFKVAAQSSSMSAWEVTNHYGENCLENASDPTAAFEALSTGSVNYVAADSTIGEYVVHRSGIEAYPIALLQDSVSRCIAVNTSNSALQSAIAEALSSIVDGGVVTVITNKWLGAQVDISALTVIPAAATETQTEENATTTDGTSSNSTSSNTSSSATSNSTTRTTQSDEQ